MFDPNDLDMEFLAISSQNQHQHQHDQQQQQRQQHARRRINVIKKRNSDIIDDEDDDSDQNIRENDASPSLGERGVGRQCCDDTESDGSSSDGTRRHSCDHHNHHNHLKAMVPLDVEPVEPMVSRGVLRRWFRSDYRPVPSRDDDGAAAEGGLVHDHDEDGGVHRDFEGRVGPSMGGKEPRYKMYRTQYHPKASASGGAAAGEMATTTSTVASGSTCSSSSSTPCEGIAHLLKQFIFIMRMRNTWKVLVFSFASVPVVMQWTASEIVLPPFLERRFGELVPIYTIQSIHMVGCLILPPFAQAYTSSLEDFRVVIPGVSEFVICAMLIWIACYDHKYS